MPMTPEVIKALSGEELSPFHSALLNKVKALLKTSRDSMSQSYSQWDSFDQTYQGVRSADKKDAKAKERGEPQKTIMPLTYAQVQVAASFFFLTYTQKPTFFELSGSGVEDWKAAKIAESVLQRDLLYNQWHVKLYQFLIDILRFGTGVIKHSWCRETQQQWVAQQTPGEPSLFGAATPPTQTLALQEVTSYLGNKLHSISPYCFFPDPRVPLTRFQDGEFCGDEEEVTRTWLKSKQREGYFAGVEFIKQMSKEIVENRKRFARTNFVNANVREDQLGDIVLKSELQLALVPADFKLDTEGTMTLGPEDYEVKYVVTLANDGRVIRCEPLGYLHNHFTYSVAQLSPDQHHTLNAGIAETIDQLQDIVTWLFNSRITSVRKTIQNYLVVDPEGIEMKDLVDRNPVIRLKKGVARSGVDRWIKQLDINDVTQSHIKDAEMVGQMIQVVTGINENAQGQYSKGRRSAEQTKAVNAGGAARLRMQGTIIFYQALHPLAKDMVSNLRDGLDEGQLIRVMGLQLAMPQSPYSAGPSAASQFLSVDKASLVGNYDFELLDGTLASEKGFLAANLQEMLSICLSNPQAAVLLGIDVKALLYEWAELRGTRNPERFFLQPIQQQALVQNAAQLNTLLPGAGNATAASAGSAATSNATAAAPQNPLEALSGASAGTNGNGRY